MHVIFIIIILLIIKKFIKNRKILLPKLHRLVNITALITSSNFKLPNHNSNKVIGTSNKATSNLNTIMVNIIHLIIDTNFLFDSDEVNEETQYENARLTNNNKSYDHDTKNVGNISN